MKGVQVTSRGDGLARGTRAASTWALTFVADGSSRPMARVATEFALSLDLGYDVCNSIRIICINSTIVVYS